MDGNPRKPARVLIVEDEPMLALVLEEMLTDFGFASAGVAGSLERALGFIESGGCDVAIVDANLNGVSAAPVAAALTDRGLPFIVTSGYSPDQLPEVLRAAPNIQKPYRPETLIDALNAILSRH